MAWFLIKDNKIDTAIAYDGVSPYTPAPGYTLVEYDGEYQLGWEWDSVNNVPIPSSQPSEEEIDN